MSEQLRLFFAVPLAADLKEPIVQVQQQLKLAGAKVSWTQQENLHFTLKFLGDTPQQQVDELSEVAGRVAESVPAHQVQIVGVGGFPSRGRPRVVWVGCTDESQQLTRLGTVLDEALAEAGLAVPEKRSFTPHLTIGRVRSRHRQEELAAVITELSQRQIGQMAIDHFVLMQSQLHPQGAVYTPLNRFDLQG